MVFSGFLPLDFFAGFLPLVDFLIGAAFAGSLPLVSLGFAAARRALAAASFGSSLTTKSLVILPANKRSFSPRGAVSWSNDSRVCSVWRRSLAYACQVARRKSVSRMFFSCCLCFSGKSPSKTGMMHYRTKCKWLLNKQ